MVRDRFNELMAAINLGNVSDDQTTQHTPPIPVRNEKLDTFFYDAAEIESSIENLYENIQRVQVLQNKYLTSIDADTMSYIQELTEKAIDETNERIRVTRLMIKGMEHFINNLKCAAGDEAMMRGRHMILVKKFSEVVVHYRAVQRESQMKYSLKLEKQIKTVKPNASQKEIEKIIESGGDSGVDLSHILNTLENKKMKSKSIFREVEIRNRDIRKIEKTIKELNALFIEMDTLVNKQQRVLDNIEIAVNNAKDYTEGSGGLLESAMQYQGNSKTKKVYFILFILALLIICVVAMVEFLTRPSIKLG